MYIFARLMVPIHPAPFIVHHTLPSHFFIEYVFANFTVSDQFPKMSNCAEQCNVHKIQLTRICGQEVPLYPKTTSISLFMNSPGQAHRISNMYRKYKESAIQKKNRSVPEKVCYVHFCTSHGAHSSHTIRCAPIITVSLFYRVRVSQNY